MKSITAACVALAVCGVMTVVAPASASEISYSGNGKFSISSKEGSLETVGGTQLTCVSDTGSGQLAASPAKTALLTLLFKECVSGGKPCTSSGEPSGSELTVVLKAEFIKKAATEVVVFLKPATGTKWLATTKCGATTNFNFRGGLLGKLSPVGSKTKSLTATFEQRPKGKQEITEIEGKKEVLEASFNGEETFEVAGLESTETLTLIEGEGELKA